MRVILRKMKKKGDKYIIYVMNSPGNEEVFFTKTKNGAKRIFLEAFGCGFDVRIIKI